MRLGDNKSGVRSTEKEPELQIALSPPGTDKLWHGTSLVTMTGDVVMSRRPETLPMQHPDQQMHVSFLLDQSSFQTHEPSNVRLSELPTWPGIWQGSVHSVRRAARPRKRSTATKHQNKSTTALVRALVCLVFAFYLFCFFGVSWVSLSVDIKPRIHTVSQQSVTLVEQ